MTGGNMRKVIALLLLTGLLGGCASTSDVSASEPTPSDERTELPEEKVAEQGISDDETTEPEVGQEEQQPTQLDESELGGQLLRVAEEAGLLDCFELLGPDFARAANGVESIVWYCLPEQNVSSLQVVISTYDSEELRDAALAEWEGNFSGLAEQYTWANLKFGTMWVGVLSQPDEWDESLPSDLRSLWGWSQSPNSESEDAAVDSVADEFVVEAALENVSNLLESAQESGFVECTGNLYPAEAMDVGFGTEVFTSCQTDFGLVVINEYPSDAHAAAASESYINIVSALSERVNLAVLSSGRSFVYIWGDGLVQLDVSSLANFLGFESDQILKGALE